MRSDDALLGLPPLPAAPLTDAKVDAFLFGCITLAPRTDSCGHTISRVNDGIGLIRQHYPNVHVHMDGVGLTARFSLVHATPVGFDGEDGG